MKAGEIAEYTMRIKELNSYKKRDASCKAARLGAENVWYLDTIE